MNQPLSVVIRAHNPRRHYLTRVLNALQRQTLSTDNWELLLIDNASENILASEIDLSWHPKSRHIREEEIGSTMAQLRGIAESTSETIVFVDDDNVLDASYLETALWINKEFPFLGAWGGQILPEFEITPPEWTKPFWGYLAIREFDRDKWSNLLHQFEATPHGAGMCVRRAVAEKYAANVQLDPTRSKLGRDGTVDKHQMLLSCEDTDLAYTACDMYLGTGLFATLKLVHLIPANRLTQDYFSRIVAGTSYSLVVLESLRGKFPTSANLSLKAKVSELYRLWTMHPKQRQVYIAAKKANALAAQTLKAFV